MKAEEWELTTIWPSKGALILSGILSLFLMNVINSKILDFMAKLIMIGLVVGIVWFLGIGEYSINIREVRK